MDGLLKRKRAGVNALAINLPDATNDVLGQPNIRQCMTKAPYRRCVLSDAAL